MAESESALDEMTTAEAAFVLGVDPTRIKKACANHVVEAEVVEQPASWRMEMSFSYAIT